jgi:putative superfamily III holin-X
MVNDGDRRPARDLSARELTVQLGEQLSRLVSAEIALARAELFASARQMILGGGLLGGAGAVAYSAWLAFAAAAIAGISVVLPVWASALIVGGGLGVLAGLLALLGRGRMRRGTPPLPMTTDSVRTELSELATATSKARHRAVADHSRRPARGQEVAR